MSNLIKRQLYSAIMEIVTDTKHYYNSGMSRDFNHFTDSGKQELITLLEVWAPAMLEHRKHELEELAKELVIKELKR